METTNLLLQAYWLSPTNYQPTSYMPIDYGLRDYKHTDKYVLKILKLSLIA